MTRFFAILVSLLVGSTQSFGQGISFVRQPLVVKSDKRWVLVQTVTADRQMRFQVCTLRGEWLASDEILTANLNTSATSCDDVTRRSVGLDDEKSLRDIALRYSSALQKDFDSETHYRFGAAFAVALGSYAIAPLGLKAIRSIGPRRYAAAAALAGVTGTYLTVKAGLWEKHMIDRIRARPPSHEELDLTLLVQADHVTDPNRFAPEVVFGGIERSLGSAFAEGIERSAEN